MNLLTITRACTRRRKRFNPRGLRAQADQI